MAEERDFEAYLSVGCPMVLHPEPSDNAAPRFATCMRGWSKSSYMLIDRPKFNNRYAAIRENQPCIMRFVYNGLACAFDTLILDWDTRPYHSYCRISWPAKFQTVAFRKFERIRARIPCVLYYDGVRSGEGVIEDLSIGGCRITTRQPFDPDANITMDFSLPDGCSLSHIEAIVKNVRPNEGMFNLGCQFHEGQAEVESDIAFYVTSILERNETRVGNAQRVLVIEENKTITMVYRNLFEQKNFEVISASSTLDGLSRVRLSSPNAVLVSQKMSDLPGMDTVKLIHATRGLEGIPLYLYGGDLDAANAREVGATNYFPQRVPAIQVAKQVMAELESQGK